MIAGSRSEEWNKRSLSAEEGGRQLDRWFYDAREGRDTNVLVICGAGVSMGGATPGPSGARISCAYENYLVGRGETIPDGIAGDLGKLYECFCYPKINGVPEFNQRKHDEFAEAVTRPSAGFRFCGRPNSSHKSLEREVRRCGYTRVYSVNVDEFFSLAEVTDLDDERNDNAAVVNAAELTGRPDADRRYRDWGILAAHGRLAAGAPSVWSHRVLSTPLDMADTAKDPWDRERQILQAAIKCIGQGPHYHRVVFAGVCSPLSYLLAPLRERVSGEFEWMWINPCVRPQGWLLCSGFGYEQTNGDWVEAGFADVLTYSHFFAYKRWVLVSCHATRGEPGVIGAHRHGGEEEFVKSIHRARRIFTKAQCLLSSERGDTQKLDAYHKCNEPYDPPVTASTNDYRDAPLAVALSCLHDHGIRLSSDPGNGYPVLTVAVSQDMNVSAHVFLLDQWCSSPHALVSGIAETYSRLSIRPGNFHVVVIAASTSDDADVVTLQRMLQEEVRRRLPRQKLSAEVVMHRGLASYLDRKEKECLKMRARNP